MDDIRAVMDAAGCQKAPLLGTSEGGALSILFAAAYPERVTSLVLYGSYARRLADDDYRWGVPKDRLEMFQRSFDDAWATGRWWDIVYPDVPDDPPTQQAWARFLRVAASPGMAKDLLAQNALIDIRDIVPTIRVPTFVLHRIHDRWVDVGNARYLADHIEGATLIELPGADHRAWLDDTDALLDAVQASIAPDRPRSRHVRVRMGVDALSRREREIADLAVGGQTTPDIARALFLSERTVESHLANAYAKLGVNSRVELVRRSNELGL
jgi:pimeloyl-ACP methyl ester carboxylesterase/DNA-binding CsgD family transcriptional regulator